MNSTTTTTTTRTASTIKPTSNTSKRKPPPSPPRLMSPNTAKHDRTTTNATNRSFNDYYEEDNDEEDVVNGQTSDVVNSSSSMSKGTTVCQVLVHHKKRRNDKNNKSKRRLFLFRQRSQNQQQQQQQLHHEEEKEEDQQQQQQQQQEDDGNHDIEYYIPNYLRQYVHPYYGDFCYSVYFHPMIISQLLIEGFLTIASNHNCLLPKLHEQRCVVHLLPTERTTANNNDNSTNANCGLHISKSTKKKMNKYNLTINQAFHDVVKGCHKQHGRSCWLYPPLVNAFHLIYQQTINNGSYVTKIIEPSTTNTTKNKNTSTPTAPICHLRLYSIEVWNNNTNALVGGEIGYSVGSIYTSLTGFCCEDSAGSVQLGALGSLLIYNGFTLWDMGMEMEYKKKLGSILMPRKQFVRYVHTVREKYGHLIVQLPSISSNTTTTTTDNDNRNGTDQQQQQQQQPNRMNCKDILLLNSSSSC